MRPFCSCVVLTCLVFALGSVRSDSSNNEVERFVWKAPAGAIELRSAHESSSRLGTRPSPVRSKQAQAVAVKMI